MKEAISLFKAGAKINADQVPAESVHTLRLVCDECLEPVILVQRGDSRFFAHWPRTSLSPECSRRREWDGTDRVDTGEPKIDDVFERKVFQETIRKIYGIIDLPPLTEETAAWIRQLTGLMHQVWIAHKRIIDIRDLTGIPSMMIYLWPPLEKLVEMFSKEAVNGEPGAIKSMTGFTSLGTAEHVKSVCLLFKQLHLKRVEEDLVFLFQAALELKEEKTGYTDFPLFAGDLIFAALKVISAVPWLEMDFEAAAPDARVCSECGQAENPAKNFLLFECHDCHCLLCPKCRDWCEKCDFNLCSAHAERHREYSCPDCGQGICDTYRTGEPDFCIVCGEEICSECFHSCEACSESICDDCSHDEWICGACGQDFCETKCEDENVEKVECPRCNEPFCSDCAESDFVACEGCNEKICEECLKECTQCGKKLCEECLKECTGCGEEICGECGPACAGCGDLVCKNCREECTACDETFCNGCVAECRGCGDNFCPACLEEHEQDCLNDTD